MKPFNHINASSLDQLTEVLSHGNASLIAGGTDLLGTLKDNILPDYPTTVVNIKSVPGMDYILEDGGVLKIGANTHLADISENPVIREKYTALAEAAHCVATPNVRYMATIAGNLAQKPRCWYYRKPENRFNCLRKGGSECFAVLGQNKFHSIFGGMKICATPCTSECPAGTDIPSYMALIRAGDWDGAARKIMEVNPMPAITSRVCAHFCQSKCNRCKTDEGLLIGGVERTLGDYIFQNSDRFYSVPEQENGKSVAIVGSGPSGLSAAFYLRKAGNKVTVYETKNEAGGMLMYAIPAYRLPKDIVRKFIKILESMGIVFKTGVRIGKDISPAQLEAEYDSVCYATGAWKRPVLGISGEELAVFGLDFLVEVNEWMKGKIGKDVLVTGGGNVAMDVAVTAKRLGARNVTMACLEPKDRMPASSEEIARAEEEGVKIMPGWGLSKVIGEDGKVNGMELKRCVSPWDESGRFNPQYDENDKTFVEAENVLMAVGQKVDLSFLDEKYKVQLSRRGLIDVIDDSQMTSRSGIFAGGDVTTGPKTVIGGIASGHAAANGMNRYLGNEQVNRCRLDRRTFFDPNGLANANAFKLRELDSSKRRLDAEDSITPTMEEAASEAARCLDCSCYAVHPSDIAPALIALEARVVTTKRSMDVQSLFDVRVPGNTVLDDDEVITEIQIPAPLAGSKSAFIKFAYRKSIDFPVVNCAVLIGTGKPRICLNAVAPMPVRARAAEAYIAGKEINEATAEAAGEAAVADANPFADNNYKVQLAKVMVKRTLLAAAKAE